LCAHQNFDASLKCPAVRDRSTSRLRLSPAMSPQICQADGLPESTVLRWRPISPHAGRSKDASMHPIKPKRRIRGSNAYLNSCRINHTAVGVYENANQTACSCCIIRRHGSRSPNRALVETARPALCRGCRDSRQSDRSGHRRRAPTRIGVGSVAPRSLTRTGPSCLSVFS